MIKWWMNCEVAKFEREWKYDASYVRIGPYPCLHTSFD
jgi:hypothetical protein